MNVEIDGEPITNCLADLCPVVSCGLQSVVDMNRPNRWPAPGAPETCEMQQGDAVTTTTERDYPACGPTVPLKFRSDLLKKRCFGQGQLP